VLPSGPAKVYPETTVNGEFMYDYDRSAWYFRDIKLSYSFEGKEVTDKLTGHIKWVRDPRREINGQGQYQYDVRVNEPEEGMTVAAMFEESDDEASFFSVDKNLAALVGTATYKDLIRDSVLHSSKIVIDLTGNNLSKIQMMNLTKLLLLVGVVPMNAE
ncbi:MAG: hypothetical protein AABZ60_23050, partial [Planctomycetota bacterium]